MQLPWCNQVQSSTSDKFIWVCSKTWYLGILWSTIMFPSAMVISSVYRNPPTPADGRGSASEKRLQAARFDGSLQQEQDATGKRQKRGKKKQKARRKVQNGAVVFRGAESDVRHYRALFRPSLSCCLSVAKPLSSSFGSCRRKRRQEQKDS